MIDCRTLTCASKDTTGSLPHLVNPHSAFIFDNLSSPGTSFRLASTTNPTRLRIDSLPGVAHIMDEFADQMMSIAPLSLSNIPTIQDPLKKPRDWHHTQCALDHGSCTFLVRCSSQYGKDTSILIRLPEPVPGSSRLVVDTPDDLNFLLALSWICSFSVVRSTLPTFDCSTICMHDTLLVYLSGTYNCTVLFVLVLGVLTLISLNTRQKHALRVSALQAIQHRSRPFEHTNAHLRHEDGPNPPHLPKRFPQPQHQSHPQLHAHDRLSLQPLSRKRYTLLLGLQPNIAQSPTATPSNINHAHLIVPSGAAAILSNKTVPYYPPCQPDPL